MEDNKIDSDSGPETLKSREDQPCPNPTRFESDPDVVVQEDDGDEA